MASSAPLRRFEPPPAPSRRFAAGRQAASKGDFDFAASALVRTANEYREDHQPTFEVFALVELAAIYHHEKWFDLLPPLARRAREVIEQEALSPAQVGIVRLAIELIESGPDDPAGLDLFTDGWARGEAPDGESDLGEGER